ncbi:MAG: hypothetical protein AAFP28_05740 [Pseudomonadota bacterium]
MSPHQLDEADPETRTAQALRLLHPDAVISEDDGKEIARRAAQVAQEYNVADHPDAALVLASTALLARGLIARMPRDGTTLDRLGALRTALKDTTGIKV